MNIYSSQRDFIKRHVTKKRNPEKQHNGIPGKKYLPIQAFKRNSSSMQNLYFKTLGIDEKTVSFTLTQKDEISSKDDRQFVREHSKPFPTVESHYCRKNTSRKYLEKDLSINKCTICTNKNVRKKKERQ